MSLGRLLTEGRSLVGGQDGESRYQMNKHMRLPKFGSGRNPFTTEARNETPSPPLVVARADRLAPAVENTARSGAAAFVKKIATFGRVLRCFQWSQTLSRGLRDHSLSPSEGERVRVRGLRVGSGNAGLGETNVPLTPALSPVGGGEGVTSARSFWFQRKQRRNFASVGTVIRGLGEQWSKVNPFSRQAKPAIPRFEGQVVQGELSLEKVRVVRNDLSEADLEIVPSAARVVPEEPFLATAGKPDPAGNAWSRLTTRFFGAGTT